MEKGEIMKKTIIFLTLFVVLIIGCSTSKDFNSFNVTWLDYNNEILEVDLNVKEGDLPTYDGTNPIRESDKGFIYSFDGWDKEIEAVQYDITYRATYDLFINEALGTIGLKYELLEDDTYSVSAGTTKWDNIEVIIPSIYEGKKVTSVGYRGFKECEILETIYIPTTVKILGYAAFFFDRKLRNIEIPKSVNFIDGNSFSTCLSLKSLTIPYGVTQIPDSVFWNTGLESIEIPDSVTRIGDNAFAHSKNLEYVKLPRNLKIMEGAVFNDCPKLKYIVLPKGVENIELSSFHSCINLEYVIIPDTLIYMGNWMFERCSKLTIYSEYASLPFTWSNVYNPDNRPVYWKGQWHFNEFNEPVPNE
jgi:hypothetical protein